jgi:hypothetical protein
MYKRAVRCVKDSFRIFRVLLSLAKDDAEEQQCPQQDTTPNQDFKHPLLEGAEHLLDRAVSHIAPM